MAALGKASVSRQPTGVAVAELVAAAGFGGEPAAAQAAQEAPGAKDALASATPEQLAQARSEAASSLAEGRLQELLSARLGPRLDEKIDARLGELLANLGKDLDAKLSTQLDAHLETKLDAKVGATMDVTMSTVEQTLNRNIESKLDKKVDNKLDRKIDFKVQKVIAKLGDSGKLTIQAGGGGGGGGGGAMPKHSLSDDFVAGAAKETVNTIARVSHAVAAGPVETNKSVCSGFTVKNAPKEWCGVNDRNPCFSHFELRYILSHAGDVGRAVEVIRAPGCFPHGKSFATMGYFRTGSTLLYNTARLWAALGAGEGLVSGFGCVNPRRLGIGTAGPAGSCTLVCKDHLWHSGVPENTDTVLMSRRDPYESVCSRKLMDMWCRMPQKDRTASTSQKESEDFMRKCKADPEEEALEAGRQCKDLMAMQADIYYTRHAVGKRVAIDVLMGDYKNNPHGAVTAIGRAMGICEAAVTDPALVGVVVAMGQELHKHPDHDMGVTQMHDVHHESQRAAKCGQLREWMRRDAECRAWMDADASAEANSVLKKMEADATSKLAGMKEAKTKLR